MDFELSGGIPNNKDAAPLAHYSELFAALEPEDVVRRTGAEFDGAGFTLDFLGHRLRAEFPAFALGFEPGSGVAAEKALTSQAATILVMRYLIRGERSAWLGKLLSYRELPWGETYDSNFNGRCRIRLAYKFSSRLDDFRRAAALLGGTAVDIGDAAFDFPLPGGITVRVIVRQGDEEFPPTSQFLFSDNVQSAWDAEDLAVMGEVIISALTEAAAH